MAPGEQRRSLKTAGSCVVRLLFRCSAGERQVEMSHWKPVDRIQILFILEVEFW